MTNNIEKRKHERKEITWPITVSIDHGSIEGETVNISIDGISICCDDPLPINETIHMTIMPTDHDILEITGKVVWSDFTGIDEKNSVVGMGICFVEISDNDRHFFNDVISAHLDNNGST